MSNNDDKLLSAQVVARFSAAAQAVIEEFRWARFEGWTAFREQLLDQRRFK